MEQQLVEIVEQLRSIAPDVWATVYHQQTVFGYGFLGAAAGAACLLILCIIGAVREDYDKFGWILAACAVFAIFVAFLIDACMRLANPAYYAIKDLLP